MFWRPVGANTKITPERNFELKKKKITNSLIYFCLNNLKSVEHRKKNYFYLKYLFATSWTVLLRAVTLLSPPLPRLCKLPKLSSTKISFFWAIKQRVVVNPYRRFGTSVRQPEITQIWSMLVGHYHPPPNQNSYSPALSGTSKIIC